ncbi:MAG: type VI secretion system baseplate subunit TssK [Myxococcales bacterium]
MAIKVPDKVAWTEGLLMLPQHLQQQDRYHENLLSTRFEALDPLSWGALRVDLDPRMLSEGSVSLTAFEGILPDGTPLSLAPGAQRLPQPRAIQNHFSPAKAALGIYLALPEERPGINNYSEEAGALRYQLQRQKLFDASRDDRGEEVSFAAPNPLLLFEDEDRGGTTALKIAELTRNTRGELQISDTYIPPCLRISASPVIAKRLSHLLTLMTARHRALTVARRQTGEARSEFNAADVTRYLLLNALNAMFPSINYLAHSADVSPRSAFLLLSQLAGQLATFSTDVDVTRPLPFDFTDLDGSFRPLCDLIEQLLSATDAERFATCALSLHEGSRHHGDLADSRFEKCVRFVVALESKLPRPQAVQEFVQRAKVASHDDMDIVLASSVGGVGVTESLSPPPELPVRPGLVYFDLPVRPNDVYWKHIWSDRNIVVWLPPTLQNAQPNVKLLGLFGSR